LKDAAVAAACASCSVVRVLFFRCPVFEVVPVGDVTKSVLEGKRLRHDRGRNIGGGGRRASIAERREEGGEEGWGSQWTPQRRMRRESEGRCAV